MKTPIFASILTIVASGLIMATYAQDVPGVSAGVFFESRTDNKIDSDELSFNYYGVRLKLRDERFLEGFVDLGIQGLDLNGYTADDAGAFGIGGILWLTRADGDLLPVDAGLYGSFHVANYTLTSDSGNSTDAQYTRTMAQGIIRAASDQDLRPYLRAGVLWTKLSPDEEGVLPADGLDDVKPAVNVGAEFSINQNLEIAVEGNYSEGVGVGVRLDYWF